MQKIICAVLVVLVASLVTSCQKRQRPEAGLELVKIPGGSYQMGDLFGDGDADEGPVQTVKVGTFYLGVTEVTVGQFKRFVAATGYQTQAEQEGFGWAWNGERFDRIADAGWRNPGFTQDDTHPVVNVSWLDAQAFCEWAGVRLPSESEWEYAARNRGEKIRYAWGNDLPVDSSGGNVGDLGAAALLRLKLYFDAYDDGFVFTAPVRSFHANKLGLYDVSGNVWEWCANHYEEFLGRTPPKGKQFSSLPMEFSRSLRGGSFEDGPAYSRLSERAGQAPSFAYPLIGFRVAASRKP